MLMVDFKSKNIASYEKTNGSIYNVIGYSTHLAVEFFKVATGCFEESDVFFDYFDKLKKEKGGLIGLVDYLIDLCEDGGFFTYLTGNEAKKVAKTQLEKLNRKSLLSEEEKAEEAVKLMIEKLNSGIQDSKNAQ